ncbi:MAG TPA: DUF3455 domain-containing protein [Blastocatellia bacterium]|nr:DUF3455 domain-containing protein [Blastocatellia bacterium]
MKTAPTKMFRSLICVTLLCAGIYLAFTAVVQADDDRPAPYLPTPLYDSVQVPPGHKVASHVYAQGVQIYRWNGASWVFVAPSADLFADANYQRKVGTHYGGPNWESNNSSKVIGSRDAGCAPNPTAIAWLRLKAVSTSKFGIYNKVTFTQRVNTISGLAPTVPGTAINELAEVPYTTEYYFYRTED